MTVLPLCGKSSVILGHGTLSAVAVPHGCRHEFQEAAESSSTSNKRSTMSRQPRLLPFIPSPPAFEETHASGVSERGSRGHGYDPGSTLEQPCPEARHNDADPSTVLR